MLAKMDTATALKASIALPQFPWESPVAYRARAIRTVRIWNADDEIRKAHELIESRFRTYARAVEDRDAAFHACRGMSGPDEEAADAEDAAAIAREELKAAFIAKWALQRRRALMGAK